MKRITFKFKDRYTNGKWITQHCTVETLDKMIQIYGLNEDDVEWELVEIEELKNEKS